MVDCSNFTSIYFNYRSYDHGSSVREETEYQGEPGQAAAPYYLGRDALLFGDGGWSHRV